MLQHEEERKISITDITKKISGWFNYVLSKWLLFVFAIIIGVLSGLLISFTTRPKYNGLLTFVLSSESKSASFAGLASQFGLDLSSSGGNDVFSGDNIITLFQSKKMIKQVLFKTPPQQKDVLANIIVKEWGWDKKWAGNGHLKNIFPFPNDQSQINEVQDSLVTEIYNKILEENLSVSRPDKKLSVYRLNTISTNQIFSCYLTKYLMDETASFYINTKTSISKNNLRMLEREADSLKRLLGGTIVNNASEVDRTYNLNPALQIQRSSIQKGQVNATVLGTAYGEVVKNLELAKINLERESPLYQIIDSPTLPLKAERFSKLKGIIFGSVSGLLLMLLITYIMFLFNEDKLQ